MGEVTTDMESEEADRYAPPFTKYSGYYFGDKHHPMSIDGVARHDVYVREIKRLRAETGDDVCGSLMTQLCNALIDRHELALPYECDLYAINRYCWCERDECPWCGDERRAYFTWKPTDLRVWWYKHAARGLEANRKWTAADVVDMAKLADVVLEDE